MNRHLTRTLYRCTHSFLGRNILANSTLSSTNINTDKRWFKRASRYSHHQTTTPSVMPVPFYPSQDHVGTLPSNLVVSRVHPLLTPDSPSHPHDRPNSAFIVPWHSNLTLWAHSRDGIHRDMLVGQCSSSGSQRAGRTNTSTTHVQYWATTLFTVMPVSIMHCAASATGPVAVNLHRSIEKGRDRNRQSCIRTGCRSPCRSKWWQPYSRWSTM
ncbi:hypothetical protein K474DRAFT_716070 [Panus rudis PR-1116 ss-1]|nr:hypothetical protein K474DRAFT_716070 [Panus rudis PR-1116 ss-1]